MASSGVSGRSLARRGTGDHVAAKRGEPQLPVVMALAVAVALPLLMPPAVHPGPRWPVSLVLFVFAVSMLVLDPGRIDRRSQALHRLRIGFVLLFAASVSWATAHLIRILLVGSAGITNSPTGLLRAGSLVWVGLLLAFAFLYWELDLGGPGERANSARHLPDLAFVEDLSPDIARPGWRPTFVDYLYLGVTTNLAFSPTDVMPLAHWAKLAMALQSVASLLVVGLVVARAVNILH